MVDRDSYAPGALGYDEFVADARALLEIVRTFSVHDASLEQTMASHDVQRLVDSARRSIAATAVDELGTLADLLADVARAFSAPIEEDLRAAKRLLDMTFAETNVVRMPDLKPVETLLFDPSEIPEFRSWRTEKHGQ